MRRYYRWDVWIYPPEGFLYIRHRRMETRYRWRWLAAVTRLLFMTNCRFLDGSIWIPGDIYEVYE